MLVRPDAEWPADVVEDDRGLRIGSGEVGQVGELGMVQPGLKGEAERCQPCKAGPPGRIKHLAPDGVSARPRERVARVPGDRMPNAAKAAVSGRDLGFQHPCDPVAKP